MEPDNYNNWLDETINEYAIYAKEFITSEDNNYSQGDMVIMKLKNTIQNYVDNPGISDADFGRYVRNCFEVLRNE